MQVTLYRDNSAETVSLSPVTYMTYMGESSLGTIGTRLSIVTQVLEKLIIAIDFLSEEGLEYRRPRNNYSPVRRLKGPVLLCV